MTPPDLAHADPATIPLGSVVLPLDELYRAIRVFGSCGPGKAVLISLIIDREIVRGVQEMEATHGCRYRPT